MADIFHHFLIKAPQQKVFEAVSTLKGLDVWWTKRSSGEPEEGAEYKLFLTRVMIGKQWFLGAFRIPSLNLNLTVRRKIGKERV